MKFGLRFPTEIIFGNNTINQIGTKSQEYRDKAFLVTGRSAMRKAGSIEKIMNLLRSAEFDDVYLDW